MRHHGIAYCIHCTTVPAVKFGLCFGCLQALQQGAAAALVAQIAVQRDPAAPTCKACEADACTQSDGLCRACRRKVA